MKKIIFFFLFIIYITSCVNEHNNSFVDNFILIDSIEIKNSIMKNISLTTNQDNQYLFYKNNKIISIDSNFDKIQFEVSLKNVDSLNVRDFLYVNRDSIFLCSVYKNDMYITLTNSNGDIIRNWNINSKMDSIVNAYFFIDAKYLHPMTLFDNMLYFQGSYHFKLGLILKQNIPIEIKLDLSKDSILKIGDLPAEYKNGEFYGNYQYEYSRTFNKNGELIFSFPICNKLYVFDKNGKLSKSIECKSKYIDAIKPITKDKYFDLSTIIDSYTYYAQYADIIYDKYNDLYYRIALHKLNKYQTNGKINDFRLRKWSIIILNKNLKKVNEILMPENKFSRYIIITKKGLFFKSIEKDNLNKYYIYKYKI